MKHPLKMPFEFSDHESASTQSVDVFQNLKRLEALLKNQNAFFSPGQEGKASSSLIAEMDAVILTSKDPFMSEYVPLSNHHRYAVTGFTGSTGDCIYWSESFRKLHPQQKAVSLLVDGRYHLQADLETSADLVEVVKLDLQSGVESTLLGRLGSFQGLRIAVDPERISKGSLDALKKVIQRGNHELHFLKGDTLLEALRLPGWKVDRPIFSLGVEVTGRRVSAILDELNEAMSVAANGSRECLNFTCAADDAAFLFNARGYHTPNHASILAYTFLYQHEVILFLPLASAECPVNLDPNVLGQYHLTVIRNDMNALKLKLSSFAVNHVFYHAGGMNGLLPTVVSEIFPAAKVQDQWSWIIEKRVRKTPEEVRSIQSAFLKSSAVIAKTLRYGKKETLTRKVSELELSQYLYQAYAEAGATSLSFSTICGAGANSAIVHYSQASADAYFNAGDMALLDSGAYYAEGFCTDCTRGFFVGTGKPQAWQIEIYTLTLKAAISVLMNPVPKKLNGREVDHVVRSVIKSAGYDYLHGTGHGVGIHVHEEGIRFSSFSSYPQTPDACVSVEPGIYLNGQGGVRIENIVFVRDKDQDHYQFENCVYVGYDWDLIDLDRLTPQEKEYLKHYEAQCKALGTQLMECPL